MPASPLAKINGGTAGLKASVTAGSTVQFNLNSLDGIRSTEWEVIGTDETGTPATYPITLSGLYNSRATITAGAAGTAGIMRSKVNGGIDPATEKSSSAMQTTIKWFVPTTDGLEVLCGGEVNESNTSAGTAEPINEGIRAIAAGGSSADFKHSVRIATTANDSLSGLAARDGVTPVAGNRVLVKDHATGASKGIYVAAAGAWSRAADFNDNAEVTAGALVYVEEGTANAETIWVLTTVNPITVGSTSLTFEELPDPADKVALDAKTLEATAGTIALRGGSADIKFGEVWSAFYRTSSANPATSGLLRGANNTDLVNARNAGNSADVTVIKLDSSNDITVGDSTDGRNNIESVPTGGYFAVHINASEKLRVSMNGSNVRLKGESSASSTEFISSGSLGLEASNGLISINAVSGGTPDVYLQSNGATRVLAQSAGITLFSATPSYGSGTLVLFVANASGNPSTNPTGGGILYSTGGAGTWRGSGGTVTTFGPAEPHCPTCARDYAFEARNDDAGEHLAICWSCMLDVLDALPNVDVDRFAFVRNMTDTKVRVQRMRAARERDDAAEAERVAQREAKLLAEQAAEDAMRASLRFQWRERRRLEAEAAEEHGRRAAKARHAVNLAECAARAVAEDDCESATWLLSECAEAWKAAGLDEQMGMALGLARAVAPESHIDELEQIAAAIERAA